MKLHVFGSSSKGNAYLLQSEEDALLIECGTRPAEIIRHVGAGIKDIRACLVSHEHGDHAAYAHEISRLMIPICASDGTLMGITRCGERPLPGKVIVTEDLTEPIELGGFKVRAFPTRHDARQPQGFIIWHEETGDILFATDTYYIPYRFTNLRHIIVECNYDTELLEENTRNGSVSETLRSRTLRSHMSLDTCRRFIQANDNRGLQNVILIHLSDRNSDEVLFCSEIQKLTNACVCVARKGTETELNNIF